MRQSAPATKRSCDKAPLRQPAGSTCPAVKVARVVSEGHLPPVLRANDLREACKGAARIGHVAAHQAPKNAEHRNAVAYEKQRLVWVARGETLPRGPEAVQSIGAGFGK